MKKSFYLSLATTVALFGAAYKIPEQSARSVALAGAYVATPKSADAAYFNPANMSFMDNFSYFEASFTGIYLAKVKYAGNQIIAPTPPTLLPATNTTESERFLVPHLHFVSKPFGKFRFGLALTTPAGLSKKWDSGVQSWFAKEFSLRTAELNPSVSYKIYDNFSLAVGGRVLFTDGKIVFNNPRLGNYYMDGDIKTHYGYNLALSYRLKELTFAATYRSKIDLRESGKVDYSKGAVRSHTQGTTKVPLPATLSLAVALQTAPRATFEFVYERTYWSKYDRLIMTFADPRMFPINVAKNWQDTNTYRIGFTYQNTPKITTMYGFAYDETPVPAATLGYELPDSDAYIFSIGALYKYTKELTIGVSYLYDYKISRRLTLADANRNGIVGKFSNASAQLLNLSFNYRY